ncbi:DegT/DnrJ/EryC1/StrS family aminotransferase [uncultured Methanolobus sp.]|uniref:DegT/DnrJ/EryC1/StrS family aminotransferase n=1 Tax=uncultured Methanolobus sp. TaxID=218300 RepID=UPI0029C73DE6|nr:DegT/DnrJ/EryC1/StrS family aminotransferase [uncultured Methanolobus sp.]
MKPNPFLIPRFNIDYSFVDFLTGLSAVILRKNVDLDMIKSEFSDKDMYFANYSRTGICLILQSLNLPKGSKVGVPLYSCTVVFDAIINAGLIPKFIDIDENYTLDPIDLRAKIHDLSALIVIHTFGRPADMDAIKDIASDIPIIEDCAHSMLSEYKGSMTGTIGDFSCFSLPKYLSAGGGGMVLRNSSSHVNDLPYLINSISSPSFADEIIHLFVMYGRAFFYHKPWFGLFALPIGLSVEGKVDLMDKKSFTIKKINVSDKYLMSKKLKAFRKKVETQRAKSLFLLEALEDTSFLLPHEMKDTVSNYYLFPLQVPEICMRDGVCDYLREKGIDTSKLFSQTPEIAKIKYGYQGDCPNTEMIAQRIFTVPNHYNLSKKDISNIANILKGYSFLDKFTVMGELD